MENHPWLPTPLGSFFSNELRRQDARVTFEWAPTSEKRCWTFLAIYVSVIMAMVVGLSDWGPAPAPLSPVLALVSPVAACFLWLVTNFNRVAIHVSDQAISVERFDGSTNNYRMDQIEGIEVDGHHGLVAQMIWGERVDLRVRLRPEALADIVDEVRRRLEARAVGTYRVATSPLPALRVDELEPSSSPVLAAERAERRA